jgi:hypothetical protein
MHGLALLVQEGLGRDPLEALFRAAFLNMP